MNRQMTIALLAIAVLAACTKGQQDNKRTEPTTDAADVGSPSIDFVKGQASRANGLTLGQVLDNNPNCAARQWSAAKDKYGRDVVTFRCSVQPSGDRATNALQTAVSELQQIATMQGNLCSVDTTAFVEKRTQSLEAYWGRFKSITEVLEFVVNQGQVVENRAGIFDAAGEPLALNSFGVSLISSDLQDTGDGQPELDRLYRVVASGSPSTEAHCDELKRAKAGSDAASAAPSQPGTDAGITISPGDAEPEPKSQ